MTFKLEARKNWRLTKALAIIPQSGGSYARDRKQRFH